jgi:nitrate/nitrite transporter NarK
MPLSLLGAVAGLIGAAGSFGGMLFNLIAGAVLTASHSYASMFLMAGLLHPASFVIVLLIVRKVRRLDVAPHLLYTASLP